MSAEPDDAVSGERVVIGRLGRPHGVRGTLHARPTGATLATITYGERVWVVVGDADARPMTVAGLEGAGERLRIGLEGVADRDAAAALTGALLEVPAERVVGPSDPDTFFVEELIGCVVHAGERVLGEVVEVHAAPANDVLEVAGDDEARFLPFTADAVIAIDPEERIIRVRPGLVD